MRDSRGVYYYPFPQNKRVRMYVRPADSDIEFRLWNQDDPQMWEQHGWVPHEAIEKAKGMYQGGRFDPNRAYDVNLAKAALEDAG
jgi:hypothetical protein